MTSLPGSFDETIASIAADFRRPLNAFDAVSYVQGLKDAVAVLVKAADRFRENPTQAATSGQLAGILDSVALHIAKHPVTNESERIITKAVDRIDELEHNLHDVVSVLICCINGELTPPNAADWVRDQFPEYAREVRPAPPGEGWSTIDSLPTNTWVELFNEEGVEIGRLPFWRNDVSRKDLWIETEGGGSKFVGAFTHWRNLRTCSACGVSEVTPTPPTPV